MKQWLAQWLGLRPVMRIEVMTEKDKALAFRSAPDTMLWRAILASIDELAMEYSDRAVNEEESDRKVWRYLGGQEALMELKTRFLERENEARKKEVEDKEHS
jgi:hypothetical protein